MKQTVKRLINFSVDRDDDIALKLERMAEKGLFLEECSSFLWVFRKGRPQKLKYTVTYFPEGSVFNPGITDNQQTYFEYAAAAGWDFVAQFHQMQIFCNREDNPIPFETDEGEKLKNIKKCMNKSFIPAKIVLILVFTFNLIFLSNLFLQNPIDFLLNPAQFMSGFMMLAVVIYEIYYLLNYLLWCRRSETSIANGGTCVRRSSTMVKAVDIIFIILIFAGVGITLFHLATQISWGGILLAAIQIPILTFLFGRSIQYLKRKKASATRNKVISFTVLILGNFAYLVVIAILILKFGFATTDKASTYQTISLPISDTYSHEFKLYQDEIPLTCEDLYGQTDYAYYSYESKFDSALFLSRHTYRQEPLPAKDAPPRIEYEILETPFKFVYQLAKRQLLKVPEWQNNTSFEAIDNSVFDTVEAYQCNYEGTPTGDYLLFLEQKIIVLNMQNPPNEQQIQLIKDRLFI